MSNLMIHGVATQPTLVTDAEKAGHIYFCYDTKNIVQYNAAGVPTIYTSHTTVPSPGTGKITIDGTEYTLVNLENYWTKTDLAGESGASKIGVEAIPGVTGTNVQAALAEIMGQAGSAYKTILRDGTKLRYNFYRKSDAVLGDTPDFTLDMPSEFFVDQANTLFYGSFDASAWITDHSSATTTEQSAATTLDGKPVLVLTVKGVDSDNATTYTYSFLDMASLAKAVTASNTSSLDLAIDGSNNISGAVKVSATAGNAMSIAGDGLMVDISTKEDKLTFGDTDSVDFTRTGDTITADLKLASGGEHADNALTCVAGKGLYSKPTTWAILQ